MTNTALNNELRAAYLNRITAALDGEEILVTGSNEITIPCLDSAGTEKWVQIVVKIPKGERGGDDFDGYALAADYKMKQEAKAEKAKEAAAKKAAKIARDEANRKKKKEKEEACE